MDDKQKRRLNRQFAVTWFLLMLTILAAMFLAVSKAKVETHNFVGQQGPKGESIIGPIGPAGESIKGKDGTNGHTTIIENSTTVYKTEPVKGEKGDPGQQGPKGDPAPQMQIQVNPENKNLEFKYSTDTFWNVLIPCEQLLKECDGSVTE